MFHSVVEEPADAAERRAVAPITCYRVDLLPAYDRSLLASARETPRVSRVETISEESPVWKFR